MPINSDHSYSYYTYKYVMGSSFMRYTLLDKITRVCTLYAA